MACASVDDQTAVVAMVNFAISAQFGLIYSKQLLVTKPIFSHKFSCRAFKLYHKLLCGHFIMACAFGDDRTTVVAMVAISARFDLIYSKKSSWFKTLSSPTVLVIAL